MKILSSIYSALTVVAVAAAVSLLGGCAGLLPVLGSGQVRTPEQRQADRETLQLLLEHCELTANFDTEIAVSARSGLELHAGGTCKPTPLKDLGKTAK